MDRKTMVMAGFALAICCVSSVMAQGMAETGTRQPGTDTLPDLADHASLEAVLRYAELNSPELAAAFATWKAAAEKIPQAEALPDPRLTVTYYVEEVETRVGPQRQAFGIAQTFPWFSTRRLRGDAATAAAAAAGRDYVRARLALLRKVTDIYCDAWYLARAIELAERHIKLLANLESVARTRFKAGSAPHSALIQAQVELGKLDDRLRSLQALIEPTRAGLNALLNRDTDRSLALPASLLPVDTGLTEKQALQSLVENNPELQRLRFSIEEAHARLALARRAGYPDVTFGLRYIQTDDARSPDTPGSGRDPVMASVSLALPVWRSPIRAARQEGVLRKAAAEETYQGRLKALEAELKHALYRFHDAERKIDLYRDTLVPKAEESLRVSRQAFETGSASFNALIDAERMLLEFQLAELRALADKRQNLAEIEMLTGGASGTGAQPKGATQ